MKLTDIVKENRLNEAAVTPDKIITAFFKDVAINYESGGGGLNLNPAQFVINAKVKSGKLYITFEEDVRGSVKTYTFEFSGKFIK